MDPTTPTAVPVPTHLPALLAEMAERFLSRQSNQFLLSGNTFDLVDGLGVLSPVEEPAAPERFGTLDGLLARRLEERGRLVATFDIAYGLRFTCEERRLGVRQWWADGNANPLAQVGERKRREDSFDRAMAESRGAPTATLRFLEQMLRFARIRREGPVERGMTLIVKHAETLLPDAPLAQMGEGDRQRLALLEEWLGSPEFGESVDQVVFLSPTAAAVHEGLRRLPHLSLLAVRRPEAPERRAFIDWLQAQSDTQLPADHIPQALEEMTAGMTLLTIRGLFLQARHEQQPLDAKTVLAALNRLLENELGDKLEVVKPRHSMADVVGVAALKAELDRVKRLLATRDAAVAPTGILVAGPNGVGKTYIFEAWATECDRLVVVLKNLRGMYFGETDQIFEKLRGVLESLGNVIVFVDEADTVFAKPGRDTHETEARLFGNVIRMMSDPKNRGRIVWLLLTARPDRLAPDLKRSGRAGLHLPVFDPEGADRTAYVNSVLARASVDPAMLSPGDRADLDARTAHLSPADFNELLSDLKAERALAGRMLVAEDVRKVVAALMPSPIGRQRRLQTLNALLECSRTALVPPSLLGMGRDDIEGAVAALEAQLQA